MLKTILLMIVISFTCCYISFRFMVLGFNGMLEKYEQGKDDALGKLITRVRKAYENNR